MKQAVFVDNPAQAPNAFVIDQFAVFAKLSVIKLVPLDDMSSRLNTPLLMTVLLVIDPEPLNLNVAPALIVVLPE